MLALEIVPASLSYIKYLRSLSIKIFKETLANQVTGDDIQLYLKVNVDSKYLINKALYWIVFCK